MSKSKYTPISRSWLIFFSIIYAVILIVGATGLGFALTFGDVNKMTTVLTEEPSLGALQDKIDAGVRAELKTVDLNLPRKTHVVTKAELRRAVVAGLAVSANFNAVPASTAGLDTRYISREDKRVSAFDTAPLIAHVQGRVAAAARKAKLDFSPNLEKTVNTRLKLFITEKIDRNIMQEGYGIAYPMATLMTQTSAIVGGILGVLVLAIMRASAHQWARWFKAAGRVTYVIGFLGGIGAMFVSAPTIAGRLAFGNLGSTVLQAIAAAFAPTWEKVAGVVVVIGLVLALVAQVMARLRPGDSAETNYDLPGPISGGNGDKP